MGNLCRIPTPPPFYSDHVGSCEAYFEIGVQRTGSYGHPKIDMQRTETYGHPVQDQSFDHKDYYGIKFIKIRCGAWINSLQVEYKKNGELIWTPQVGGGGGDIEHQIALEDGEIIIEVKGKYGRHGTTGIITSLTFTTNRDRHFGPFGKVKWWWRLKNRRLNYFQMRGRVVGFHRTSGGFVSSIGCYMLP